MVVPDINPGDGLPENLPAGARRRGRAAVAQPGLRSLGFDRFSRMPTVNDFPQIGDQNTVEGVWGALQNIGQTYLATVMNAAPIFRVALATWAVGVLTGLASSLETLFTNEAFKNTPAGKVVQNLLSRVKVLIALIGPFTETQKEFMKGDMQLAKSMNDIAKPAG